MISLILADTDDAVRRIDSYTARRATLPKGLVKSQVYMLRETMKCCLEEWEYLCGLARVVAGSAKKTTRSLIPSSTGQ